MVDFSVSGDSEMKGQTTEMAEFIKGTMQSYLNSGGHIELDGEIMPSLVFKQGATPWMDYGTEGGGRITVELDSTNLAGEIRGVLIARDRGHDLAMAIRQSGIETGSINFANVDAIMAGLGYIKRGITCTYGEHTENTFTASGTGELVGGGNVGGDEGRLLTARDEDILLPGIDTDQLPRQQLPRPRLRTVCGRADGRRTLCGE